MEDVSTRHHNKSIREGAKNYAKAYAAVEKYIIREMELRKKIRERSSV